MVSLNRADESYVNALFLSSLLPPLYIGIVKVGELPFIKTNAKFPFLSNGVKVSHDLGKLNELLAFKDGKYFSRTL